MIVHTLIQQENYGTSMSKWKKNEPTNPKWKSAGVIRGDDGYTPTPEEITSLIKPLIPDVKNGETPTDEKLLELIKPLIPAPIKGKDGKNPSIDEILKQISITWEEIKDKPNFDRLMQISSRTYGISEMEDVSLTNLIQGDLLQWNGTKWVNIAFDDNGILSLNGLTGATQTFEVTTLGRDFTITSAGTVHSFNLPTASAINRGALSSTDWNTFNNKQDAISLTTTGTSGVATFISNVLNIPDYGSALSGYVPYTGATANVDIGHFSYIGDALKAFDTAGVLIESANGTDIGLLGVANTANVTWYGNHNFNTVTASRVAQFGASKTLESSTVTTTELGYLSGVTSAIQTQLNAKEPTITAGTTAQYWRGDKSWQTLDTSVVPENTNLYFTNARAIASTLTGYVSGAGTVAATDSILQAIQKLNGNIGVLVTGVSSVSGTTNRITASPTTGAVVVDIASTYVGQTSITTLGTITTGVWNGTAIANANLANSSISFSTGTSGSDLNWSSSPVSLGGTATVNIPSMAATSVTRGLLTNTTQTLPGDKTFNSGTLTVTKTGGGDSKLVLQNSSFSGDFAFLTLGNSAVSRVGVRSESTDKATYLYAMPNGTGVFSGLNSTFSLFTTDFVADSTNISFMQMQAGVGLMGINMRNGGTGTLENFNFLFNSTVTATLTTAGLLGVGTSTGTAAPDYRLTLVGTNATTPQINLRSSRSAIVATNVIGGVIFTSNDTNLTAPGTEVASFQALATATHSASVLTTDFVWKGTNTLAYAETMRLTGEGLLGIGVTPTKGWLEIKAGTTTRSAITLTAGTNKTSSVAGDLEYDGTQIYFTNGGAVRQTIQQVQRARVASAFARTSSTTLTNITGLSVTVAAGKTYEIYAVIPTTSALSGGVKFAIGGTCTATTINYTGTTQDAAGGATYMSKSAALGGTVGEQSNVTNAETVIRGEIIVNAGGTLTVQFGQNTSNASASTCTVGGQFVVTQIA